MTWIFFVFFFWSYKGLFRSKWPFLTNLVHERNIWKVFVVFLNSSVWQNYILSYTCNIHVSGVKHTNPFSKGYLWPQDNIQRKKLNTFAVFCWQKDLVSLTFTCAYSLVLKYLYYFAKPAYNFMHLFDSHLYDHIIMLNA